MFMNKNIGDEMRRPARITKNDARTRMSINIYTDDMNLLSLLPSQLIADRPALRHMARARSS